MKKTITVLLALFLTLGMATLATAEDSDDSDVEVDVSSETAVDIDPSLLVYDEVAPGEYRLEDNEIGVEAVQIENTGSNEIDRVWMDSSIPDQDPFGEGDRDLYNNGNFLQIATALPEDYSDLEDSVDETARPHFTNRLEYEEDRDLSYVFVPDEETWGYGRFRGEGYVDGDESADEEYFWAVDAATLDTDGEGPIRVGIEAHTRDSTGSSDFIDGSGEFEEFTVTDTGETDEEGNNLYKGNVDVHDKTYSTVVALSYDDTAEEPIQELYVVRTRFNTDFQGVDLSADEDEADYIFDSSRTDASVLEPGDSFPVELNVALPRGVASGEATDPGLLTVNVESDATE